MDWRRWLAAPIVVLAATGAAATSQAVDIPTADQLGFTTWSAASVDCPIHDVQFVTMMVPPGPPDWKMGKIFAWDARIEIGTYGMPDTFHNFKYQLVPASYTVEGDHIDIKADSVAAHLYGVIDGPDHMTTTFDYQTDNGGTFSANCVLRREP